MSKNKYHALKAIFDQEGGKLLVASLRSDVKNCADRIAGQWNTLTHDEFRLLGLEMATKERLARDLENAKDTMEEEENEEES